MRQRGCSQPHCCISSRTGVLIHLPIYFIVLRCVVFRPSVPALKSLVASCSGYANGIPSPAVTSMIAHAALPLITCASAAWMGLLNPSCVSDADGFLLLCGDEQCIAVCASAVVSTLQCISTEPPSVLACFADATLLVSSVTKHHNTVCVDSLCDYTPSFHSISFVSE